MCDRNFGIGADGLILLEDHPEADFEMRYFNSDGHSSSMCGNGGRCAVAFAHKLGLIHQKTHFRVNGGHYSAQVLGKETVSLAMEDVPSVEKKKTHCFLDTGSPHHVVFVPDVRSVDVVSEGRSIRYGTPYSEDGTNVNFVAPLNDNQYAIRTYERGVEGETLACGTGAVAAALAIHATQQTTATSIQLEAPGGLLQVDFIPEGKGFTDIYLTGPAVFVFEGIF
jgi:diaminopimelate epimerase